MCVDQLYEFGSGIGDFFGNVGSGISDFAGAVGSGASDLASGASSAAGSIADYFGNGFNFGGGATAPAVNFPIETAPAAIAAPAAGGYTQGFADLLRSIDPTAAAGAAPESGISTVANAFRDSAATDSFYNMSPETAVSIANAAKAPTSIISGFGDVLKNNANWLVPAGMLGATALKSQQQIPGLNQLKSNAAQMAGQAGPLMDPLLRGGALPSGAEAGLAQGKAAMEASIRSQYAKMGLSGSTMEAQALAAIPGQIQAQKFQMATSLYQQGLATLGVSDAETQNIMKLQLGQDQQLTDALARIAAATSSVALKDLLK
jgi:hypothetical protein